VCVCVRACMLGYKERRGKANDKGKKWLPTADQTAGVETAEDVDGLRISLGRMRVCSRSPTAFNGDTRRDKKCHPITINLQHTARKERQDSRRADGGSGGGRGGRDRRSRREGRGCVRARGRRSTTTHGKTEEGCRLVVISSKRGGNKAQCSVMGDMVLWRVCAHAKMGVSIVRG